MDAPFFLFLALTGASVGFLSGLLGIGGGIVMFPLLLYAPPLFGLPHIDVKGVTGLTMVVVPLLYWELRRRQETIGPRE